MLTRSNIDFEEWDRKTLTASDYSVEVQVKKIYMKYYQDKFGNAQQDNEFSVPMNDFNDFMMNYFQKNLYDVPKVFKENSLLQK